jgi:hypothetical protein
MPESSWTSASCGVEDEDAPGGFALRDSLAATGRLQVIKGGDVVSEPRIVASFHPRSGSDTLQDQRVPRSQRTIVAENGLNPLA